MLKMDLSLTEGLAEELCFHITDLNDETVNLAGINFTAYLKRRGEDEVQLLKAEHGAAPGELVVHMPACAAGVLEWELWRSSDAAEDLFLGGCVTVFSVARVVELALHGRTQRQFAVRTQESGPAWQVRALPGNAAEATLEKIREAYSDAIVLKREVVYELPAPEDADVRTVYYFEGAMYLVVDGEWMRLDSVYDRAVPDLPGLLCVNEYLEDASPYDDIVFFADVVAHPYLKKYCVKKATKNEFGVIKLSDDFNNGSGDAKADAPIYVRRASIRDVAPGLVAVEGSTQELADSAPAVYKLVPTVDRAREIAQDEAKNVAADGKLDTDMGNLASGLDVVVSYSYDAETGTWWRLWRSGWCEQGGIFVSTTRLYELKLPIEMLDTNYGLTLLVRKAYSYASVSSLGYEVTDPPRTTTSVTVDASAATYMWEVKGMAREIVNQVVL